MIFPELKGASYTEVNLDVAARQWRQEHPDVLAQHTRNPLLLPDVCQQMVDSLHEQLDVVWSYGGWMEDRSALWKDSYMERDQRFTHLGVDFNVRDGTRVATLRRAEIIRVDIDPDQDGGWGPRVILQPRGGQSHLLIYAHLQNERFRVGQILKAGEVFCAVGTPPTNGNWYHHLHIQAVTAAHYAALLQQNLSTMDGYCTEEERDMACRNFPYPGLP